MSDWHALIRLGFLDYWYFNWYFHHTVGYFIQSFQNDDPNLAQVLQHLIATPPTFIKKSDPPVHEALKGTWETLKERLMFIFAKRHVLVRSPNNMEKSYLETLISASIDALRRNKHLLKITVSNETKLLFSKFMTCRNYFCNRHKYADIKDVTSLCIHDFHLFTFYI